MKSTKYLFCSFRRETEKKRGASGAPLFVLFVAKVFAEFLQLLLVLQLRAAVDNDGLDALRLALKIYVVFYMQHKLVICHDFHLCY